MLWYHNIAPFSAGLNLRKHSPGRGQPPSGYIAKSGRAVSLAQTVLDYCIFLMMKHVLYSDKEKMEIYCGSSILIFAISLGAISVTQFWHNWILGLGFLILSTMLTFHLNTIKYRYAIKLNLPDVSRLRVCIVDSILPAIVLIYLWCFLFIPIPFTIEAFLNPEDGLILPFGIFTFGPIALFPVIYTNKRLLACFKN